MSEAQEGTLRPDGGWVQVNCSVFPDAARDRLAPYIPWERLADAVDGWRHERRFERFFFVRKPPGLRLRFAVGDPGRLLPVLAAWLSGREAANDLRGFRFTVYEPEAFRFGGAAGMELAHDLFDADARAALEYEQGAEGQPVGLSRAELSAALTNCLLGAALDDPSEAWDVWCRLREAVLSSAVAGRASGGVPVEEDGEDAPALPGHVGVAERLPPPLAAAYRALVERQQTVASRLRATADAGLLTVGVRSWLVSATVFHWNRWGLPLEPAALRDMTERMVAQRSPERPGGAGR
ncbi:MAG: thiopeptide-type bacteriocin biosynthesis protein [Actinobacteria bacterium]|nr:thiopeptide-type bacteriocin biosynthesis protein [Actinomycetota bacterium]